MARLYSYLDPALSYHYLVFKDQRPKQLSIINNIIMKRIVASSFFGLKKSRDALLKIVLYYMSPGLSTGIRARNNNFVIFFFAGPQHDLIRCGVI